MDLNPSKVPSAASTRKNKGVETITNPSDSSGRSTSDSERTNSADFGVFLNCGSHEQEVVSHPAREEKESDSERTESASFGKTPNVSYAYHFSEVDSGMLPRKGGQNNPGFQPKKDATSSDKEAHIGYNDKEEDVTCHGGKIDNGAFLPAEAEIHLPQFIKDHPNKEVDLDGWMIEIRHRIKGKGKDKYYRHRDYDHVFRSKPEVKLFLDTGMAKLSKVLRILQKRSADPRLQSSRHYSKKDIDPK
ncbi:hypothetical protein GUJ93_ZPchr0002g23067 [Zizania palustris]|uniref:MBD domain-containing protein n=1 Tax=Zizania palustris TaxID=103762 RepID=A0A8J5RLV1_ZIZPA|nr:hypothetical protein GUJ93_ZPchr0002g23067 [Zizania palustris]